MLSTNQGRGFVATLRLKLISAYHDRHGRLRRYFKHPGGGRQIPLPGLPGSAEFMDAYAAALAGQGSPLAASAGRNAPAPAGSPRPAASTPWQPPITPARPSRACGRPRRCRGAPASRRCAASMAASRSQISGAGTSRAGSTP